VDIIIDCNRSMANAPSTNYAASFNQGWSLMTSQLTSTSRTFKFLVYGTCERTSTERLTLPTNSNITFQSAPVNLDAVLLLRGPFDIIGSACTLIMYGMRMKMLYIDLEISDSSSVSFAKCIVDHFSTSILPACDIACFSHLV
jgi:hypothetical protein